MLAHVAALKRVFLTGEMEAIILAGGKGTRLGKLTQLVPKPMLPVPLRPFLEYVLDYLAGQGVVRVILSVGHLRAKIISHFGRYYSDLEIDYAIEEGTLGTGGAIRLAMEKAKERDVFVLNGDTLFRVSLKDMFEMHQRHHALLTIALREVDDCSRYGKVIVKNDRVLAFNEKDSADRGLINGGIYLLNRKKALTLMPSGSYSFERDFIAQEVTSEIICGMSFDTYFIDIGIPDEYNRACSELGGNVRSLN